MQAGLHERIVFSKWFNFNIDKTNIIKFNSKHYQDETFLINS
jgi:hypothetical protein